MITLRDLSLRRGSRLLFTAANAAVHPGQKVGLVGANGSGKSSLFALLLGELHADTGDVELPRSWVIAHVAQESPALEQPAIDFVLEGDAEVARLERELAAAEAAQDGVRLGHLHDEYASRDGYRARPRAATILHGLGFGSAEQAQPVRTFSGGWRARLNLARALMCPSDLLLLDEPTNHLDLDAVIWLENWLRRYPGTLLLISHDRDFLDNVTGVIAHLEQQRLTLYSGNYAQFERQRAERLAQQAQLAVRQQREVARIHAFVERFRAKATKARQAQSRLKALARMELITAAEADAETRFAFAPPERTPRPLLTLDGASAGYGTTPVLGGIGLALEPGTRLGLLGRNGAGKSTLMKLLGGVLAPQSGERREAQYLEVGYFAQHQLEALRADETALHHLQRQAPREREQPLRDFLGRFGFRGDDALRQVGTFSGGERTRLALALLVHRRPNLLLLDEPTNHLDLVMRDALVDALQEYAGGLVVVSHDRYLLRATCDAFLLVADGRVTPFDGDLDDYRAWLGQDGSETDAGATAPVPAEIGTPLPDTATRKQQKRLAAEERNALAEKRRPLQRQLRKLEQELERLQAELDTLNRQLGDETLYTPERKAELTAALQRRGQLQTELAYAEKGWLEVGEELEGIA
ncbi:MAG TPA: ATP-binding cassette domain-containing protein [Gammaproteobacteria bacterium]